MGLIGSFLKPNIPRMKQKNDTTGLINALNHKDSQICTAAAEVLGEIDDIRAIEALIETLKEERSDVRHAAARSLGIRNDLRAIEPLIAALENNNDTFRRLAAETLGKMGRPAIEPLAHVLNSKNHKIGIAAAEALAFMNEEDAIALLKKALTENRPNAQIVSAGVLGKSGDTQSISILLDTLKRGDSRWHLAAVDALENIGKPATDLLVENLKSNNGAVRNDAVDVLEKMNWNPIDPGEKAYYLIAKERWDDCTVLGNAAVVPLVNALRFNGHYQFCNPAAEALDKLRWVPNNDVDRAFYYVAKGKFDDCVLLGDSAFAPLVNALKDMNERHRNSAMYTLEKMNWAPENDSDKAYCLSFNKKWDECSRLGKFAVEPLIAVIKINGKNRANWDTDVVDEASKALANIVDPQALDALIDALQEASAYVRMGAAKALGNIGANNAVEPLLQRLHDDDYSVQCAVAEALGKIGNARAVKPLIKLLEANSKTNFYSVPRAAAFALAEIGDAQAIEPLLTALRNQEDTVRHFAVTALGTMCVALAVDPLIKALHDTDPSVRCSAAHALAKIGDQKAVLPLTKALKDPKSEVCQEVADALDRLNWIPENSVDKAYYYSVKGNWTECLKLGELAIEPLLQKLNDSNYYIRIAAAEILGKLGDPRSAEFLKRVIRENDGDIRNAAVNALDRLGVDFTEIHLESERRITEKIKSNIGRLKEWKDKMPESDNYDSDLPMKLCSEIVEELHCLSHVNKMPTELLELFKSEQWIITHRFSYWRSIKGFDCYAEASCSLITMLQDNQRVLNAITSTMNEKGE